MRSSLPSPTAGARQRGPKAGPRGGGREGRPVAHSEEGHHEARAPLLVEAAASAAAPFSARDVPAPFAARRVRRRGGSVRQGFARGGRGQRRQCVRPPIPCSCDLTWCGPPTPRDGWFSASVSQSRSSSPVALWLIARTTRALHRTGRCGSWMRQRRRMSPSTRLRPMRSRPTRAPLALEAHDGGEVAVARRPLPAAQHSIAPSGSAIDSNVAGSTGTVSWA